jgi:hypothetical protein
MTLSGDVWQIRHCDRPQSGRLSGGTRNYTAPYSVKLAGLVLDEAGRGFMHVNVDAPVSDANP